jgi:hypothetical protein
MTKIAFDILAKTNAGISALQMATETELNTTNSAAKVARAFSIAFDPSQAKEARQMVNQMVAAAQEKDGGVKVPVREVTSTEASQYASVMKLRAYACFDPLFDLFEASKWPLSVLVKISGALRGSNKSDNAYKIEIDAPCPTIDTLRAIACATQPKKGGKKPKTAAEQEIAERRGALAQDPAPINAALMVAGLQDRIAGLQKLFEGSAGAPFLHAMAQAAASFMPYATSTANEAALAAVAAEKAAAEKAAAEAAERVAAAEKAAANLAPVPVPVPAAPKRKRGK